MNSDQEIVFAIGMAACLGALIMFVKSYQFVKSASKTIGEVIGYGSTGPSTSESSITAVIRYSVNEKTYRCSLVILSKNQYYIGKHVSVIFDSNTPYNSYVNSIWGIYLFEILLTLGGVSMLLVSYAGYN